MRGLCQCCTACTFLTPCINRTALTDHGRPFGCFRPTSKTSRRPPIPMLSKSAADYTTGSSGSCLARRSRPKRRRSRIMCCPSPSCRVLSWLVSPLRSSQRMLDQLQSHRLASHDHWRQSSRTMCKPAGPRGVILYPVDSRDPGGPDQRCMTQKARQPARLARHEYHI